MFVFEHKVMDKGCGMRDELNQKNFSEIIPHPLYLFGLTTSTEQYALVTTAEETLPRRYFVRKSSNLVAPTKIESAPQSSASSTKICFGFPSRIMSETSKPFTHSFSVTCLPI